MIDAERTGRLVPFLIRCSFALALVGPAQAQIISEIEVPLASDTLARRPKRAPRPAGPVGVTPAEVLSEPTLPSSAAESPAHKKARPHAAVTASEYPTPRVRPDANENLGLPSIDAKRWCARISDRIATANCVQFEDKQREFARIFWEDLSENGKRFCAGAVARLGTEAATNQSLAACVRTRLAHEEGGRDPDKPSALRR